MPEGMPNPVDNITKAIAERDPKKEATSVGARHEDKNPKGVKGLQEYANTSEYSGLTQAGIEHANRYLAPLVIDMIRKTIAEDPDKGIVVGLYSRSTEKRTKDTLDIVAENCKILAKELGIDIENLSLYNPDDESLKKGKNNIIEVLKRKLEEKGIVPERLLILGDRVRQGLGMREWDIAKMDKMAEREGIKADDPERENKIYKKWVENAKIQEELGVYPKVVAAQYDAMLEHDYQELHENFPGKKIRSVYVGHSFEIDYYIQSKIAELTGGAYPITGRSFQGMHGMIGTGESFEVDFDENGKIDTIRYRGQEFKKGYKPPEKDPIKKISGGAVKDLPKDDDMEALINSF